MDWRQSRSCPARPGWEPSGASSSEVRTEIRRVPPEMTRWPEKECWTSSCPCRDWTHLQRPTRHRTSHTEGGKTQDESQISPNINCSSKVSVEFFSPWKVDSAFQPQFDLIIKIPWVWGDLRSTLMLEKDEAGWVRVVWGEAAWCYTEHGCLMKYSTIELLEMIFSKL